MRCKVLSILLIAIVLVILLTGCAAPLKLTIKRPADGAILTQSPAAVSGSVNGPAEVTVNGEPVEISRYKTFETSVDLVEGVNTITAIATMGDEVVTVVVTVTYKP